MADTNFTDSGTIASTAGSIFTNPAATVTKIVSINVCNNNTTSETVQIYLVPNSAGSVGTASATLNRKYLLTLAAGEAREVTPKWTLSATNDSIQADTTTASKVTYDVNGIKTA